MKLADLKLHSTVVEALAKEGYVNLGDTKGMSEEELVAIPGVGPSSAQVILDAHAEREAANAVARGETPPDADDEPTADPEAALSVPTTDDGRDPGEPPNLAAAANRPAETDAPPAPADHAKSAETLAVEDDGTERPDLAESDVPLRWSDQQLQHICALDRECGRILSRPAFNFVNGIWQKHGDEATLAKAQGFASRGAARRAATDEVYTLFEHYALLQARSMV